MVDAVLCLGGNLGDRASYLRQMYSELEQVLLPPIRKSRLMETEPLGVTSDHPWYYNRLVRGKYAGGPREMLNTCQRIEKKLGRTRPGKYAPRTADIDILLFGEEVIDEKDLTVPHRHIFDRRFLLEGLREVAGEWIVPGRRKSINALAEEMTEDVTKQRIRIVEENALAPARMIQVTG